MASRTDFPPVRACLFDMDGLLLDTEDLYTLCVNLILEKYNRPSLPWSIKAKLQGRPGPAANAIFHDWAQLPISAAEYLAENTALQKRLFPSTQPLPGIPELLSCLGRTRYWELRDPATGESMGRREAARRDGHGKNGGANGAAKANGASNGTAAAANGANGSPAGRIPHRVHIALATSSHAANFKIKTSHLTELFSVFETNRRVLGDDPRIPTGRGKPLPDIYLVALRTINDSLAPGEPPIRPDECLVFEDSVPGVEAGRRAGMRVVWCPHPMLKSEYAGREREVDMHQVGELDDGWADYFLNLVDFPYEKYGIAVPDPAVEEDPLMKEVVAGDLVVTEGGESVAAA